MAVLPAGREVTTSSSPLKAIGPESKKIYSAWSVSLKGSVQRGKEAVLWIRIKEGKKDP
jgi:hypothetical protein